jgi:hypothetical protein
MATDSVFHWARIAAPGKNFAVLAKSLEETTLPELSREGGKRWALANGLFGLWNHEVILVTSWAKGARPGAFLSGKLPVGASLAESYEFVATVRPETDAPLEDAGVYVHRLFGVDAANVGRFVALSDDAWKTFESATRLPVNRRAFSASARTRPKAASCSSSPGTPGWSRGSAPARRRPKQRPTSGNGR